MTHSIKKSVCNWCNGSDASFECQTNSFDYQKEAFSLLKCNNCKLVRTAPLLNGSDLEKYYSCDYYGTLDAKFTSVPERVISVLNNLRAKWFYNKIPFTTKCKLLDIGPGRGGFLRAMSALGVECYGIEREEFPENETLPYKLLRGDLKDQQLSPESFDAVTLWHVLEHLEEPYEVISRVSELLKPGGLLLVAVPNYDSWQSKWFPKVWFHLDIPRHLHHFSSGWLVENLKEIGVVEKIATLPTIEQSLFGFIQSLQSIMLRESPNRLYKLLQRRRGLKDNILLAILIVFAFVLAPFALAEYILSAVFGRNASVVFVIKKT